MEFSRLNPFIPKASVYRYPNGIFELQLHLLGTVFEVEVVPHTDHLVVSGRVCSRMRVETHADLVWTDFPAGWFGKDIPLKLNPGTECVILEKKQINERFIVTYTLRKTRISRQASMFDGHVWDDLDGFSSDPCTDLHIPAQETDAHLGFGLPYSHTGHQNSSQHNHPIPEPFDHNCFHNGSASLNMFQDRFSTPPGYDCQACYAVPFGNVTSETNSHQHDCAISNLCEHSQTVWRSAFDGEDSYEDEWYSSTSGPSLSVVEVSCEHNHRDFGSLNLINKGPISTFDTPFGAGETVIYQEGANLAVQATSDAQPVPTIATHHGDVLTFVQGQAPVRRPPSANSRYDQAAIIPVETSYEANHELLASSNYEHIQPQSVNGVAPSHVGSGWMDDFSVDYSTVGCGISSNELNIGTISHSSSGVSAIRRHGSTHAVFSGTEPKREGKTFNFDIAEGRSKGARIHDSGHAISSGISAGREDVTVVEGRTGGYTTSFSNELHTSTVVDALNSIYEDHRRSAKATSTEDHQSSGCVQVVNQQNGMHVEAFLSADGVARLEGNAQGLHRDGFPTNILHDQHRVKYNGGQRVHCPAILTPGGEPLNHTSDHRAAAAEVEGRMTFVDHTQAQQRTAVGVTFSETIPSGAVQAPFMSEHNTYSTPVGSGPILVGGLVSQNASPGTSSARPFDSSAGVTLGSIGNQVPAMVLPTGSSNIAMDIPLPSQALSTASYQAQSMQVPTPPAFAGPKLPRVRSTSSSSSSSSYSSTSTSPSLSTVGTTTNTRPSQGAPAVVAGGLWSPGPETTPGLASEYYDGLITGQSTAHAGGSQGVFIRDGFGRTRTIARSEGCQVRETATTTTASMAVRDATSGGTQMGAITTAETVAVRAPEDITAGIGTGILQQEQDLVMSCGSSSSSTRILAQEEYSSALHETGTEAVVIGGAETSAGQYPGVPEPPTQVADYAALSQQLAEDSTEVHGTTGQQTFEYIAQSSMREGTSSTTSETTKVEAKVQEAVTTSIVSAVHENVTTSLSQTESVEGQQLSTRIMTDVGKVQQAVTSTSTTENARSVSGEYSTSSESTMPTSSNPQISLNDCHNETAAKDVSASLGRPIGLRENLSHFWVAVPQRKSNESQRQSEAAIISSDNRVVEPLLPQDSQAIEEHTSTSTINAEVQHSESSMLTSPVLQRELLFGTAEQSTAMEASKLPPHSAALTGSIQQNTITTTVASKTDSPSPEAIIMPMPMAVEVRGAAEAIDESTCQENGAAAMTSRDSVGNAGILSRETERHEFIQVESEVDMAEVKGSESETKAGGLANRYPPITETNDILRESHQPIMIEPDDGVTPTMQDEQTYNEKENTTTTMKTSLRIRSDLAQASWNADATDMDSFSKSYRIPDSTFSSASDVSSSSTEAENAVKFNLNSSQTLFQPLIRVSRRKKMQTPSSLPPNLEDRKQSFRDPVS